jgi:hypothetical protein
MPEEKNETAQADEAKTVVDDALHAAEGSRAASRWLASALGALPSLAVLGAIVRAPGESGFNPWWLGVGVGLAAVGALIGVLGFARVIEPVPLEDADVRKRIPLNRLPGVLLNDWHEFDTELQGARTGLADAEDRLRTESSAANLAKATAEGVVAIAEHDESQAEASPDSSVLKERADASRAEASRKQHAAVAASARASASAGQFEMWSEQVSRRLTIRQQAYLLAAADEVRTRYRSAQWRAGFAVAFIAAGVVCLGLAPRPAPPASANVSLVRLDLNQAGKAALGCSLDAVLALRTGGTDAAPVVITLPQQGCPARALTFSIETPHGLGSVSDPKP